MAVCFTLVVGMIVMVWCTVPLFGLAVVVGHGSGTVEKVRERNVVLWIRPQSTKIRPIIRTRNK